MYIKIICTPLASKFSVFSVFKFKSALCWHTTDSEAIGVSNASFAMNSLVLFKNEEKRYSPVDGQDCIKTITLLHTHHHHTSHKTQNGYFLHFSLSDLEIGVWVYARFRFCALSNHTQLYLAVCALALHILLMQSTNCTCLVCISSHLKTFT